MALAKIDSADLSPEGRRGPVRGARRLSTPSLIVWGRSRLRLWNTYQLGRRRAVTYCRWRRGLNVFPARLVRQLVVVVAALAMLAGVGVQAQPAAPLVIKLSIHDTIQPITAD